jgi:uncharacterized surface protein with fasciclin (FAS1) repeats
MRKFFNIKNSLLLLLLATIGQFTFTACSDEPDAENLYTFTGEMASDYLSSRDKFSEFTKILQRAKSSDEMASYYNLLATYGHYTVFAPTNDAIETYLEENGLSSIDELSVADCDTIARTHIIQSSSTSYFTTDMTDGVIETTNMLDRYLNVGVDTATLSDGTLKTYYTINDKSRLIVPDDSVENGVVHTVDHVLATSTKLLPEYIEEEGSLNMFYEILKQTHMEDSLRALYDENYVTPTGDSCITGVYYHTASEWEYAVFPKKRAYGFTAFCEPDDVYKAYFQANGEEWNDEDMSANIPGMQRLAKKVYDEVYPEDAGLYDADYTNRKNPLNRFISYHLLDRLAQYSKMALRGSKYHRNQFKLNLGDITDWYETMMPYSVMQVSSPLNSLYINRKGIRNKVTTGCEGVLVTACNKAQPQNGVMHYIDKMLFYDKNTRDVVLNCRFRFDASTMSPDIMTAGYPEEEETTSTQSNRGRGFKAGSMKNITLNNNTTLVSHRMRVVTFWSYEGDEVIIQGQYDFTLRLPPVPAGTYELRLGYCSGFESRGIIQIYCGTDPKNLQPEGIPLDLRKTGTQGTGTLQDNTGQINYIYDADLTSGVKDKDERDELIAANDKAMHNRGYMKGPASCGTCSTTGLNAVWRDQGKQLLRRVIKVVTIDEGQDYYVRFKQTRTGGDYEFQFDYFEMCPKSIYDSPEGEDKN